MSRSHMIAMSCGLWAAVMACGCGGGMELSKVAAAHRRPSNVAVYFKAHTSRGEPISTLIANDFEIYEDGVLVSVDESRQTIVNPQVAAEHYTLLLVDMSASVTESDDVPLIVEATEQFLAQLEDYQQVAVYAFDGSRNIHRITPFSGSEQRSVHGVQALAEREGRDPSTNLHGAVIQGLEVLDRATRRTRAPLAFGTLVVFTDGTDRAHRVDYDTMMKAVQDSEHDTYAIGVGNEIDDGTLSDIGKSGHLHVDQSEALSKGFQQIGDRIIDVTRSYYLLSYCSPARAGEHTVTVEAHSGGSSGELDYTFDADGFRPGCDPTQPPPFDTSDPQRLEKRTRRREAREAEAKKRSQ